MTHADRHEDLRPPTRQRRSHFALLLLLAGLTTGCASITNPTANGVPVRILPDELLASTREGFQPIPLTLLRQKKPDKYILATGDTLGIYIEGVLGDAEQPPPVNVPDNAELPPSIGYPFPIREDGSISLPYIGTIKVADLTLEEAEQKVVDAYLAKEILRPEDKRILVTLMRPRYIRVVVIRDDSQQRQVSLQTESLLGLGTNRTTIGGANRQGLGLVIELPAYENDVLNALARSGGLPGLESTQEVIIQRGFWDQTTDPNAAHAQMLAASEADLLDENGEKRIIRIPMEIKPGEQLTFKPDDIILNNGDIIRVKAREPEFYYTGGLLPANEIPLPNNYDLTVLEAILKARGPIANGGFNASNLNGSIIGAGIGTPNPSNLAILRKAPTGGQVMIRVDLNEAMRDPRENILVQAEDILLLQESTDESISRYFSQVFQMNFVGRFLDRADATGTAQLISP